MLGNFKTLAILCFHTTNLSWQTCVGKFQNVDNLVFSHDKLPHTSTSLSGFFLLKEGKVGSL